VTAVTRYTKIVHFALDTAAVGSLAIGECAKRFAAEGVPRAADELRTLAFTAGVG